MIRFRTVGPLTFVVGAIVLCSSRSAVAEQPCVSLSNLPNSDVEHRWLPNATVANLKKHYSVRESLSKEGGHSDASSEWPYGLETVPGSGDVLWFSRKFNGWKPLTDTESSDDLVIVMPGHLVGTDTLDLARNRNVLIYLVSGSPAFQRGVKGYALSGKLQYVTAGGASEAFGTKMNKPIVDAIGTDSVLVRLSFQAVMTAPPPWAKKYRCSFDGSFVFKKAAK
jgi:hypothetical protein